jgi:hypothetical protein
LFNIDDDIGEHNNLAEGNPEKVKELASRLGNYLRGVRALRPYYKKTGKLAPWPDDTFLVPSNAQLKWSFECTWITNNF